MLELRRELFRLSIEHWLNNEFLTWRWFAKIFIIAITIFLFAKFSYKKQLSETMLYGLIISLISTVLDIIGTIAGFWEYPFRELPFEFSVTHDLVVVPVVYMFVYQYFPKWKSFLIANGVQSFVASYIMEPIFIALTFYRPYTWKHIYSLPLFFIIGVFGKFAVIKLKSISQKRALSPKESP